MGPTPGPTDGMTTSGALPFGELLRHHRRSAGLSQEALAERAGLSARAISDLERGLYRAPHRDTVALLANALGFSAAQRAQLDASIVRRRGPPPTGPSATGGRGRALPIPATPLLGRDQEVAAVIALLQRPTLRLVTLLGPGGVGKTRLAAQVATELIPAFADGVAFVALAALDDPGLVASAIAQALEVQEAGGQSLVGQLTGVLAGRRLLLALDNFEHVLAAAPLVAELLAGCPELRVLVTSRAPLRLHGEQEYLVPPLAAPDPARLPALEDIARYDAVRLFVARAQQVQPDFALTPQTAPAVAAICARLDGLPLAIELAAARARLFPPRALLRRLDHRLALLVGGPRDLPARHQTLRATLDWSYGLLAPTEQTLLARLAVFVGGCSLEAIAAVCNPEGTLDVLAGVEALLLQSLLRQAEGVDGEPRYVLLETIHEYARERLAARGETEAFSRQHLLYVLELAETAEPALQGPEQGLWLARLEQEHANVRAALTWAREQGERVLALRLAGALGRFWLVRAHLSEGRRWLEGLLALPRPEAVVSAVARAKALQGVAELAYRQGDYAESRACGEASLQVYRAAGDRAGMATTLNNLGNVATLQADYRRATTLYEETLALRRAIGDRWGIGVALNNLGTVAVQQGHDSQAAALYEESLALCREVGDKWGSALALDNLGEVAQRQGDYTRATELHERSLTLCRELGDHRGSASVLHNLGEVALRQGDLARARDLYRESLALRRELGDKLGVVYGLEGLAAVARAQGHAERAARLWGAAAAVRAALGAPLPPGERPGREQAVTAARAALGAAAFEEAWSAGQALSPEQAIAEARGEHAPP